MTTWREEYVPKDYEPLHRKVMNGMKNAYKNTPWGEPEPIGGEESVTDAVLKDLESRRELGIGKYGTELKTNNGRNALKDAYEEVLDLACYLKQKLMEDD